jgi:hypothetical protein
MWHTRTNVSLEPAASIKMEAAGFSEIVVLTYHTTGHHTEEFSNF